MKKLIMGMMFLTSMSSFAAGIQCEIPDWGRTHTMKQVEGPNSSVTRTIDGKGFPEMLNAGEEAVIAGEEASLVCSYEVINSDDIATIHTCIMTAPEPGMKVTEKFTISTDGNISAVVTLDVSEGLANGTIPEIDPESGAKTEPIITFDAIEENSYLDCRVIE